MKRKLVIAQAKEKRTKKDLTDLIDRLQEELEIERGRVEAWREFERTVEKDREAEEKHWEKAMALIKTQNNRLERLNINTRDAVSLLRSAMKLVCNFILEDVDKEPTD